MKTISFQGTEEQIKNLMLAIQNSDNDLPALVNAKPIFWSVEDFETKVQENFDYLKENEPEYQNLESWEQIYDKTKFAKALEKMINDHDACLGITWDVVEYYLGLMCKVEN